MSPSGWPLALMRELGQSTWPSLAAPSPAMIRRAVDFPHPDGPSRLMNSPARTFRDIFVSATVPLENCFETDFSTTTGRCARSISAGDVSLSIVSIGLTGTGSETSMPRQGGMAVFDQCCAYMLFFQGHADALTDELCGVRLGEGRIRLEHFNRDH